MKVKTNSKKHKIEEILIRKGKTKKYTKDYLLNMTDWSIDRSYNAIGSFMVDGFEYKYNSKWEKSIIKNLKRNKYAVLVRGQNLQIHYRKDHQQSPKANYNPDIVLLNYKNEIVFVEVKPLENMLTDENKRKFFYLAGLCQQNGYLYTVCDNKFRDVNYLDKVKVPVKFQDAFFNILYKKKKFVNGDIKKVKESLNKGKSKAGLYISALIKQYDLKFEEGDLTKQSGKLLIKAKSTSIKYTK